MSADSSKSQTVIVGIRAKGGLPFIIEREAERDQARSTVKAITSPMLSAPAPASPRGQRPAPRRSNPAARLQSRQQIVIDWLLRQAASGALAVILLKTLLLFARVGQLVETVRQLNAFVIDLKRSATR
jgi:hypothetical protein